MSPLPLVVLAVLIRAIGLSPTVRGPVHVQDASGGLDVTLFDRDERAVDEAFLELVRLDDGGLTEPFASAERRGTTFRFHDLAPGRYALEASEETRDFVAKGYADVASGTRASLQLTLAATQPCVAQGRVVGDGKGVVAAEVRARLMVWPQPLYAGTTTGLGGGFTLELPRPGPWILEVRPPGWDPGSRGWNLVLGHEFACEVPPSGATDLTLALPRGRVAGRVRAPDGSPMGSWEVWLAPEDARRSGSRTRTDRDGRFEFRGLEAGAWRVHTGGPQVLDTVRDVRPYAFACQRVELPADGATPAALTFDLTRGGEVACQLSVSHGRAPTWEWLYARPESAPEGGWFLAGATVGGGRVTSKGRRTIAGLPEGRIEFSLRPDRGAHLATPLTASVEVVAGECSEVRWELVPATHVLIQAVDADGSPVFVRVLEVRPRGASPRFLTGSESEFRPLVRLRPLPAGDYVLRVGDPTGRVLERELSLAGEPEHRLVLRL